LFVARSLQLQSLHFTLSIYEMKDARGIFKAHCNSNLLVSRTCWAE